MQSNPKDDAHGNEIGKGNSQDDSQGGEE